MHVFAVWDQFANKDCDYNAIGPCFKQKAPTLGAPRNRRLVGGIKVADVCSWLDVCSRHPPTHRLKVCKCVLFLKQEPPTKRYPNIEIVGLFHKTWYPNNETLRHFVLEGKLEALNLKSHTLCALHDP